MEKDEAFKSAIRVGVIGAGKMSLKTHLPALQKLSGTGICKMQVICDIDIVSAQSAKESFGFEMYTTDPVALISDEQVDVVYVFGTVETHYQYAKLALQKGKHVFIEKPPAPNYQMALELVQLAEKNGKIIATGFNRRFRSDVTQVFEEVTKLGKIVSVDAVFDKPSLHMKVPAGARTWFGYNAIHAVDLLCHFFGERPQELYSASNSVDSTVPQNFSVLMRWANGSHAVLSSNNSAGGKTEVYSIHLPGISYECHGDRFIRTQQGVDETVTTGVGDEFSGFLLEHESFLQATRSGIKPPHALQYTKDSLYLVELAEQGFVGKISWPDVSYSIHDQTLPSLGDFVEKKDSILILNSGAIKLFLPLLFEKYNLVFEDTLSDKNMAGVKAIITGRGGVGISDETLKKLPNVKIYGVVGASVKKYNPKGVLERNIPIINASDVYAEAVAEFALLLAIAGIRNAVKSHDVMRAGGWGTSIRSKAVTLTSSLRENTLMLTLRPLLLPLWRVVKGKVNGSGSSGLSDGKALTNFKGTRVGLIGYGMIAKKFISYLKNFECEILIHSQFLSESEATELGVRKASLSEVLACNVVSLHRGLSERTRKSIGALELSQLKKGSVFINTARAEIVDSEALLNRLKKGDVYACLDVYDEEPLPKNHPLRKLPNVFLTSHIAGSTKQMYQDATESVINKVMLYLEGGTVSDLISDPQFVDNMS